MASAVSADPLTFPHAADRPDRRLLSVCTVWVVLPPRFVVFSTSRSAPASCILPDVNPYASTEIEETPAEENGGTTNQKSRSVSRLRRAFFIALGSTLACFMALAFLGRPAGLSIPLILSVLATTLLGGGIYVITLCHAFVLRRWLPATAGFLLSAIALAVTSQLQLPSQVQIVLIPIVAAAFPGIILMRESDWESMETADAKASPGMWCSISLAAIAGGWIGVATGIGKPILNALDQDIVGTLRSERIQIEITGGLVGAGLGLVIGVLCVSAIWPRRNQS